MPTWSMLILEYLWQQYVWCCISQTIYPTSAKMSTIASEVCNSLPSILFSEKKKEDFMTFPGMTKFDKNRQKQQAIMVYNICNNSDK